MAQLNLTRRSFLKAAAATGAAIGLTSAAPLTALAEDEGKKTAPEDIQVIRTACRGCGKYECGVFVTVRNGVAVKIEGDPTYPGSLGNCCAKSQASLQACYHPDRLYYPMKRTTPKGEDPGWVRISWDEAYELGVGKMDELKEKYGGASMAFFGGTSRIYAMSGMSAMAYLYDSPNIVSPAQVCKGPRGYVTGQTAGQDLYFVENVWRPKTFVQWGSGIEVSNYDDAGRTAVDNAARSETYINVDARMSNLAKEADYYLGVRPGTDGALVMAWLKLAMENNLYQDNFVRRWTDCSFLVCEEVEPSGWEETYDNVGLVGIVKAKRNVKTILLKESDLREDGDPKKFVVWDEANNRFTYLHAGTGCWEGETFKPKFHDWDYVTAANLQDKYDWEPAQGKMVSNPREGITDMFLPDQSPMPTVEGCEAPTKPALWTEGVEVVLKDGRTVTCRTVWEHLYDNCKEFTPERAEEITGVKADLIKAAGLEYCQLNEDGYGDSAINYAVTHEHTGNAMKLIHTFDAFDAIMGRTDTPGGHRGSTRTASVFENQHTLLVGQFLRVGTKNRVSDPEQAARKIGTGKFPLYPNADATAVYQAMRTGDPYPIKGGLTQAGGMLNQTNLHLTWEGVKNLDFYTNWNLWHDPISDLADLILPEAHWLEVECGRCAQGSGGYYGAHIKCVEMPGDVKWGIDIVGEWYKKNGLKFWEDREDGGDPWEMGDFLRSKAIASTGMDWQQFRTKFLEEGWFDARRYNPEGFGTCRRYETGWMVMPFQGRPGFRTNTSRYEIWSTGFENAMRRQINQLTGEPFGESFALPYYVENKSSPASDTFRKQQMSNPDNPNRELYADYTPENYPFILSTGRRIPVYFHSEHRQLPWCREVWPVPRLEVNPADAEKLGLSQGDWAWIETPFSKIRQCVDINASVGEGRMNAEHSWWFPELKRVGKGFDLSGCNCLVDAWAQCEAEGAPQLRGYLVNVYKATPENSPFGNPVPCDDDGTPIITDASDPRLKEWAQLITEGRDQL
ncbi:molybdopterin-containing oxidoreductase family protein [Parvibacter caecicola]|uniref:molybdopterin-containing oxidoreductase family protein n=1 Tax=Parvibacter caecicola TaxID=747645 RepID=UPI0027318CEA|nr:molybdopterin-dependent oxidoreductase [Parvibacter caecicola]